MEHNDLRASGSLHGFVSWEICTGFSRPLFWLLQDIGSAIWTGRTWALWCQTLAFIQLLTVLCRKVLQYRALFIELLTRIRRSSGS